VRRPHLLGVVGDDEPGEARPEQGCDAEDEVVEVVAARAEVVEGADAPADHVRDRARPHGA